MGVGGGRGCPARRCNLDSAVAFREPVVRLACVSRHTVQLAMGVARGCLRGGPGGLFRACRALACPDPAGESASRSVESVFGDRDRIRRQHPAWHCRRGWGLRRDQQCNHHGGCLPRQLPGRNRRPDQHHGRKQFDDRCRIDSVRHAPPYEATRRSVAPLVGAPSARNVSFTVATRTVKSGLRLSIRSLS